ncbi:hypothetical protein HPB49_020543 [Dermacentor silvarum]|uniref:Uncharacterized protein n=1 Tax=Dermacentor silvarum TaxID=543639 RepID=A0ACB8D7Y8_DERSI|nr:hypothetical protein HPB49_020543 [Dermacentor silvarum]
MRTLSHANSAKGWTISKHPYRITYAEPAQLFKPELKIWRSFCRNWLKNAIDQQSTEQANVTGSEGDQHTSRRSRGDYTPNHDHLMTGLVAATTYSTEEALPNKEPATPTEWDASQQCLKSQSPAKSSPADTQLDLPGVKQHENPRDTEKHSPDKKPRRGERRTTVEGPPLMRTSKCAGDSSQPRKTSDTGKRDKQHETGSPRFHRNSQICPLVGIQRKVVLVSDKNVDLVAETVMTELGSRAALEFISGKGVTAADAIAYANNTSYGARLHDVLKGTPEEVAQALGLQWTGRPEGLIICSIQEIYSRDGETQAAVVLANAKIKKWCQRIGNRVLDLGKGELSTGFQKDGLHYNEVTRRQTRKDDTGLEDTPRQMPAQPAIWTPALEQGTDGTVPDKPRGAVAWGQDRSRSERSSPAHRGGPRECAGQKMAHSVKNVHSANRGVRRSQQHPKHDIERWGHSQEVLILGDFTGHIQELNGYSNHNGKLLLEMAQELSSKLQTSGLTARAHMEGKSTLKLYREYKQEIRVEPHYDNSVASSLLFEARAGALRTLAYLRSFDDNMGSAMCSGTSLTPAPTDGTMLPVARGFSPRVPFSGGGGDGGDLVATTNSQLNEW